MTDLILEPTAVAGWQRLVREAARDCRIELAEELEGYLVHTLIHLTREARLGRGAIAPQYLEALLAAGPRGAEDLRRVGDQCLLLAGLYPRQASRRLVRVGYFVDMGRSAYARLYELLERANAQLYRQLSEAFVSLADVLQGLRGEAALSPLEAIEYWQDTGSRVQARRLAEHFGPGWTAPGSRRPQ
ncbi:MAG: hypothetical protein D6717_10660 [Gammaproteobacteria bacterium]|nr:MAG: hypothetical protein D6717_10660 [Gammaproteobacteria bacterium]